MPWLLSIYIVRLNYIIKHNLNLASSTSIYSIAWCDVSDSSATCLLYMIQREYQMNNGFSTGEEDSRGNSDQICCLVDDNERCRRPSGNAAYSKRIQKTVTQKRLKLNIDLQARHTYICDYHKNMIQCARTKQRRLKDSEEDSNEADMDTPEVDLTQLHPNTLKRYKRHYKLSTRPSFNKAQLTEAIQKHFKTLPVNEKEIMTYFIYMVKTNGNKLDQKNGMNSDSI